MRYPTTRTRARFLVAFSNAYPDRPIRDILHTEDRTGALLRIADGTVWPGPGDTPPHVRQPSQTGRPAGGRGGQRPDASPAFHGGNPDEGIFTFATVAEGRRKLRSGCAGTSFRRAKPTNRRRIRRVRYQLHSEFQFNLNSMLGNPVSADKQVPYLPDWRSLSQSRRFRHSVPLGYRQVRLRRPGIVRLAFRAFSQPG